MSACGVTGRGKEMLFVVCGMSGTKGECHSDINVHADGDVNQERCGVGWIVHRILGEI